MSLRRFLDHMEQQGQVVHIADKMSLKFEISSILNAFSDGPVFLFENVEGYKVKVVGNVCNTRERICKALGIQSEGLYQRLNDALLYPKPPRVVEDAPVREVEESPNLSKIPIVTHFERDAGPYITSGVIAARSLNGKVENVSIHRLQVLDNKHLAIRLVPRQLYKLWNMAKEQKKPVDIAISIGVHPAVLLAAACSPPFGVSEYGVANRLLGGNLQLIKCPNVDAYAPAESELVLEGRISVSEEVKEGPFVDITGTYDIQRMQPVVEVVNVMHRENYLYQALIPGDPEHRLLMGLPREASIYEAVSKVVPYVKAVNLSIGGCGWLHAVISIDKQKDGDAKNALMAAFAGHPSLKHAVVVDSDIDAFNLEEVEWAVALRFQASEDLVVIPNARGSTLDPSGDQEEGLTSKMGIDATRPLSVPKENFEKAKVSATKKATRIIERLADAVKK
jgi:2,5-furandicarboxylate decarboxylase 1